MKEKRNVILNSTILYIIAFLITTIIHEFSHALAGVLNGSEPVLHHNYVEHLAISHLSALQRVSISLAGPISSLIQGLLAGWIYLTSQKQKPLHLFLLWFSALGFSNFFGYLMTGPLFRAGDIGKVYLLLKLPLPIQIIIAVIGAAVLFFIAYKLTVPFLQFSYRQEWVVDEHSRKNFAFGIIILPWIIGSSIVTILYLPIIAIISIIYPIMSGMVFIFPWQNARRIKSVELSKDTKIGEPSVLLCFLLAVVIIGFKLILASGIPL